MVAVRAARPDDSRSLWEWRNDPVSRENSHSSAEVPFRDHDAWFTHSLSSARRRIYIALDENEARIGMVSFDADAKRALVSINLAPDARGRGASHPLLEAALDAFHLDRPAVVEVIAEVKESNVASLRLFAAAGFGRVGSSDGVVTLSRSL